MKEELVTHNTAELAKQKGFNEPCYWISDLIYGAVENDHWHCNTKINIKGDASLYVTLPTQALLQRWLREKHGIHISITKSYEVHKIPAIFDGWVIYIAGKDWETRYEINSMLFSTYYETYEQALEAGLFHALTLIENEN
jgi:hypothetical protein